MSTTTKVRANRRNSSRSTGPKSDEGKAIVSANATRHGLLSWRPVLPGLERDEEWDAHLVHTLESFLPLGHMETILAERIALILWRLGRVARYERETGGAAIEQAEQAWARAQDSHWTAGQPSPLQNAAEAFDAAQVVIDLLDGLTAMPEDARTDQVITGKLVDNAAELARVNIYDGEDRYGWPHVELPDYPDGADLDDVPWTAGQFLKTLAVIATAGGRTGEDLLAELTADRRRKLDKAQQKRDDLAQSLELFRRRLLLPDGPTMDRIGRYETALERSFYKALHELQRLQAARQGQAVPLPAVVDIDVTGGRQ